MNSLASEIRALFRFDHRPAVTRKAGENGNRFYGGPPFGRQPYIAPSVREGYRDLDGQDARARIRAQAIKMRKDAATCAKLRRAV